MRHPHFCPYGPFPAGDGRLFGFAVLSDEHWRSLRTKWSPGLTCTPTSALRATNRGSRTEGISSPSLSGLLGSQCRGMAGAPAGRPHPVRGRERDSRADGAPATRPQQARGRGRLAGRADPDGRQPLPRRRRPPRARSRPRARRAHRRGPARARRRAGSPASSVNLRALLPFPAVRLTARADRPGGVLGPERIRRRRDHASHPPVGQDPLQERLRPGGDADALEALEPRTGEQAALREGPHDDDAQPELLRERKDSPLDVALLGL